MQQRTINNLCTLISAVGIALLIAFFAVLPAAQGAAVKSVACGKNLATVVNSDPKGTATTFVLDSCSYPVSTTLKFQNGDGVRGPAGMIDDAPAMRGTDPNGITAEIRAANGLDVISKPQGTFTAEWVRFTGARFSGSSGTGVGLAGGAMSDDSVLKAIELIGNEGVGMSNARGRLIDVEAAENGSTASLGFIAGGVKCNTQCEIAGGYYHDNIGNGTWCDNGCEAVSARANGYWVHDAALANNTGAGSRYEDAATEALIENNHVFGNSTTENRGGVSIRDGQDATVANNIFDGAGYPHNQGTDKLAVVASDSGRATRTDLKNVRIVDNDLNGEVIKKCGGPVTCVGNTN
jgi:hypothetical protein